MAKNVLILGSYAPSLINFRGPLIAALRAKGYGVLAAAPEIDSITAEALRALGATPLSLQLSNASLNPLAMLKSYRELRRLLRIHRPDAILSYTIKPVILGALAGRAEGVGRVISLITGLGYAFTSGGGGIGRRLIRHVAASLYRVALGRSDVVIFQNRDDQALFLKRRLLSPSTATAIVNGSGVDLDRFSLAEPAVGVSFLMIARLLRDKGIREFVAAATRFRQLYPEIAIDLVGYLDPSPDSLSKEELENLVATGIRYHGRLDDVRPAIAACSVYVLPSYREGTPRSVLEAMAMGRAIITTDAPGCRETVEAGANGFLVPPRDADALFDAMERFVNEPELAVRMGRESRKLAEARYDARVVSADILRHAGL